MNDYACTESNGGFCTTHNSHEHQIIIHISQQSVFSDNVKSVVSLLGIMHLPNNELID